MERTSREILKRIVALLFALAELADRASLAPWPARVLVLAILRPAEAVAQAFVFGVAHDLGVAMPQAGPDTGGPDDATRLALGLRILALTLANLLALAECSVSHGSVRIAPAIDAPPKPRQFADCRRTAPAFDTS